MLDFIAWNKTGPSQHQLGEQGSSPLRFRIPVQYHLTDHLAGVRSILHNNAFEIGATNSYSNLLLPFHHYNG